MRDFIVGIGAICAATTGIVTLTACGFFHDDKVSDPEYAACRHSGYDEPTCTRRIQRMKPNNKMAMLEKGQS